MSMHIRMMGSPLTHMPPTDVSMTVRYINDVHDQVPYRLMPVARGRTASAPSDPSPGRDRTNPHNGM
jgi:hypothetical protein